MNGKRMKSLFFYAAIAIMMFVMITLFSNPPQKIQVLDYSVVMENIDQGKVKTVKIVNNEISGDMTDGTKYTSTVPILMANSFDAQLQKAVVDKKVTISSANPADNSWFANILLPMIVISIVFMVLFFMMSQGGAGGGGKVMQFGKSKAKLHKEDEGKKITFKDVAGLKEEKEELEEVVDFLKNPKKYRDLGARIPKGILMVGPPGTGKTYLSKAVAGEAGVPFFSISGSDFVEMFVGVGASRVRDLFENAKKSSPCIVFIDEIDAVGRKRGAGLGGGHDEREQTLNQLLVEMDGFDENEGIILIAATNRPDILDPALLRPGRFDRQIMVGVPDLREREAIIKVHCRNKPIGDDVDYEKLARGTTGFTPADLENMMNEAALLTARRNLKSIDMATIQEATTKVIAGVEKKSRLVSEKERKITAYHEAGHALLAKLMPEADPVGQVTIIPRGRAGGFTMQLPSEDRNYSSKKRMEQDLVVLLGGRMAEKIVLGDISTGASNDLSRVSEIARRMVTRYAFSENLGAMSYDTEEEVFLGKDMTTRRNYSETVAMEIDIEVRKIVDEAYETANELLNKNIEKLHTIAQSLLEYETLYADEFEIALSEGKEALDQLMGSKREAAKKAEEEAARTVKVESPGVVWGVSPEAQKKADEAQVKEEVQEVAEAGSETISEENKSV